MGKGGRERRKGGVIGMVTVRAVVMLQTADETATSAVRSITAAARSCLEFQTLRKNEMAAERTLLMITDVSHG